MTEQERAAQLAAQAAEHWSVIQWLLGSLAAVFAPTLAFLWRQFVRIEKLESRVEKQEKDFVKLSTEKHECQVKREEREHEMFRLLGEMGNGIARIEGYLNQDAHGIKR